MWSNTKSQIQPLKILIGFHVFVLFLMLESGVEDCTLKTHSSIVLLGRYDSREHLGVLPTH